MHITDTKAIYAIKLHLQAHLNEPSDIDSLARQAIHLGPLPTFIYG